MKYSLCQKKDRKYCKRTYFLYIICQPLFKKKESVTPLLFDSNPPVLGLLKCAKYSAGWTAEALIASEGSEHWRCARQLAGSAVPI